LATIFTHITFLDIQNDPEPRAAMDADCVALNSPKKQKPPQHLAVVQWMGEKLEEFVLFFWGRMIHVLVQKLTQGKTYFKVKKKVRLIIKRKLKQHIRVLAC